MYIVTILLIAGFIAWEIIQFSKIKVKISQYQNIFPDTLEDNVSLSDDIQIETTHNSEVFENIVSTLNRYLGENSEQVSDYHLMKDVVDRNREVSESEIETLIPFTQYIGLVGTMIGIFIGVIILVFGGGLADLMAGSTSLTETGVTDLLGGVALAVISSAVGLGLTMRASYLFKEAKREIELRENNFLSWIQSELLPELSTDFTSTLKKMTENLNNFNNTFSGNNLKLDKTLSKVNDAYKDQAEILKALERIDVTKVAKANIKVYESLKGCTDEIGLLADSLKDSRQYIEAVKELSSKLGEADERVKTWEKMGKFFEREIREIERRKAYISEAVGKVDEKVESSFKQIGEFSKMEADKMAEQIIDQNKKLEDAISQQQQLLKRNLQGMSDAIDRRNQRLSEIFEKLEKIVMSLPEQMKQSSSELSNLSGIRQGISELQKAVSNNSGNTTNNEAQTLTAPTPIKQKFPISVKISIFLIAFYCLFQIIKELVMMMINAGWIEL